jgi:hypothetical protein
MYLLVNDIKEKACSISLDFCADLKRAKQTEFLKLQYALHLRPRVHAACHPPVVALCHVPVSMHL